MIFRRFLDKGTDPTNKGSWSKFFNDLSLMLDDIVGEANKGPQAGFIEMYGAATAPLGWLLCDGSAVSRGTYSGLFAIIGTGFGTGDGSTTFNLPDFRGVFPKGAGTTARTAGKDASGNFYAATLGAYITDKQQGHHHNIKSVEYNLAFASDTGVNPNGAHVERTAVSGVNYWEATDPIADASNGTPRTGLTTEPQSLGINFIIKY